MYKEDYNDGTLLYYIVNKVPLVIVVYAKCLSHWLISGLPIILIAPLCSYVFSGYSENNLNLFYLDKCKRNVFSTKYFFLYLLDQKLYMKKACSNGQKNKLLNNLILSGVDIVFCTFMSPYGENLIMSPDVSEY